ARETFEGFGNSLDPNLSKMQMNFSLYAKETGLIPVSNLTTLFEAMSEGCYDALLPVCGVRGQAASPLLAGSVSGGYAYIGGSLLVDSEMKTGLAGAAIFSGSRMVGLLDGQRTQLLLMARGEFASGRMRLPDGEGGEMSVYLSAVRPPALELSLEERPKARVRIFLKLSFEQPEVLSGERSDALIEQVRRRLEAGLEELFTACRALESDVIGFGRLAVRHFSDAEGWESYDWKAAYRMLEAEFSVELELDRPTEKITLE
ncbi:MAG: Ger(x)C family spore germination C-terminal domain-containing protein, partial [Clostridia bacterium]|nr:Ger(x)C family spore germination C-terminal domain-containing protein [Clostridia bacterium]